MSFDVRRDGGEPILSQWPWLTRIEHMMILRSYNPKVVATLAASFTIVLCASLAARRQFVPQGGDIPAYLLAARCNPLVDNFDNPSHGWGYPAAIKLLTCLGLDEHRAGIWISAASAGLLVFVGVTMGFRYTPTAQAIALLAILSTHPVVLGMGSIAMADTLFAATVCLVVWLLFVRDSSLPTATVAGLLAMFSAFVRGNGIFLVVCAAAGLLLTPSRWRRFGAFLLGVVVFYGV